MDPTFEGKEGVMARSLGWKKQGRGEEAVTGRKTMSKGKTKLREEFLVALNHLKIFQI